MGKNAETDVKVGIRRTWGWLLVVIGLVVLASLVTYDRDDMPLFTQPSNRPVGNFFGPAGVWLSWLLFVLLGVGAYTVPVWCLVFGFMLVVHPGRRLWPKVVWTIVFMCGAVTLMDIQGALLLPVTDALNITPNAGGILCRLITRKIFVPILNRSGTSILAVLAMAAAFARLAGPSFFAWAKERLGAGWERAVEAWHEWREDRVDRHSKMEEQKREIDKEHERLGREVRREERRTRRETPPPAKPQPQEQPPPQPAEPERVVVPVRAADERPPERKPPKEKEKERKEKEGDKPAAEQREMPQLCPQPGGKYVLPTCALLDQLPPAEDREIENDSGLTSRILQETLAEFDIQAEVTNVERGPVVTRYELRPAPGVRVERIASLSNNLALTLKAASVRVQAPVPGKGVVGIEVPNTTTSKVYLREIMEGETWAGCDAALPLVLGKDVGGMDIVADLAGMPHLLVAGATGSGKTVCMNAMLVGLLMSRSPEQLRLMLVDPKIVEFSQYDGLPHLVVPVITDPHKVTLGLRWAINEMERRYRLFARAGVRNIESYNGRPAAKQQKLFEEEGQPAAEEEEMPDRLPYIVIVVDELADLMLVAQADIENGIARLAQLSRAVGIHMILATQRPSVNIITGTIKANFPARIAFQVAQRVDSRTILDANGADKLLGRGDMLFLPPGSNKLVRAQGAMVMDHEIKKVVDFVKAQSAANYEVEIHERIQNSKGAASIDDGVDDDLLNQAVEIIRETRRASTSSLQRRLRIGYTRAARMMDILEERGIVGPPRGSDPREILIDLDGPAPSAGEEQVEKRDEEPSNDNA